MALVSVDPDGTVTSTRPATTSDAKGLKIGAGVGLVLGLLAPPLLASVVVGGAPGALVGKFGKHKVETPANRLVGILHGCLRTHALYDEHLAWHNESDKLSPAA